jgi:hypothetical protein
MMAVYVGIKSVLFRLCLLLFIGISCQGDSLSAEEEHQFSQLNFDSDERIETFWGRLYLPFPDRKGFQYFRAHYGVAPPMEATSFLLAKPIDLCDTPSIDEEGLGYDEDLSDKILVVRRGNCSFAQKSLAAMELGAQGVLLVNNEDGNMHPSAPGVKDIDIFSSMISNNDGERLIAALKQDSPLNGKYVPITCQGGGSSYCEAVRVTDSTFVDEISYEGIIQLPNDQSFPYKVAEFGGYLNDKTSWTVTQTKGENYCSKHSPMSVKELTSIRNVAVLVPRGGCSFTEKARNASASGATLMILANDNDAAIAMGGTSYEGSKIHIPSIMIPKSAEIAIESLLEQDVEVVVSLQPIS